MRFQELVEYFSERSYFELGEVIALGDEEPKTLKNQLSDWTRLNKITRLQRGKYLLAEPYRKRQPSVYFIANQLLRPSYVSLHTALQFHGMIPEAVFQIQSITPKHGRTRETSMGTFTYRSIKQERFWGYREMVQNENKGIQQRFYLAQPEKALLDLFYHQKGDWTKKRIREMRFQNFERVNMNTLQEFAGRFNSPKVTQACRNIVTLYEEVKP